MASTVHSRHRYVLISEYRHIPTVIETDRAFKDQDGTAWAPDESILLDFSITDSRMGRWGGPSPKIIYLPSFSEYSANVDIDSVENAFERKTWLSQRVL